MLVTNGKGPAVQRHEFQANGDYLILSVSCHGGKSIKTDIDMTIRLRIAADSQDLSSPSKATANFSPGSSPHANYNADNDYNDSCTEVFNLVGLIGLQTGNHFVGAWAEVVND